MEVAFAEDSVAVRFMQNLLDHDRHEFHELLIAGDRPGQAIRKQILALVDREYGSGVE